MHPRRKSLNAFANILLGNPQSPEPDGPVYPIEEVQDRVYKQRRSSLWEAELPCVCLFWLTEDSDSKEEPKHYVRKYKLVAEIVLDATETSDEKADEIAWKIEQLVLHNRFLKDPAFDYGEDAYTGIPEDDPANTCDNIMMVASASGLLPENREADKVTLRIAFEIEYSTVPNYSSGTDNFNAMSAEYKVPGKDANTPTMNDLKSGIYQGG